MLQCLRLEGEDKMIEIRKRPALFVNLAKIPALYIQYPNGRIEYLGGLRKKWLHMNYDVHPLEEYVFLTKVSDL